jgi:transcriptional regulator with XRE-family HTH domain
MTFIDRLKLVREGNRLKQEELAEKLGYPQSTYARYERGKYRPDSDFLGLFCSTFRVSANWLLLGLGPRNLDEALEAPERNIDGGLLAGALMVLEDELEEIGASISAEKKADALLYLYDMGARAKNDVAFKAEAKRFLRLIA